MMERRKVKGRVQFPVIDLNSPSGVAGQIDEACREVGFFAITGHGVPQGVIDHAWSAATRFFDRPLEEKLSVRSEIEYPYGYTPMSSESLASSSGEEVATDLNESFSLSPPPRAEVAASGGFRLDRRVWPKRPEDFKVAWTEYYNHMERLAGRLMRLCASALEISEAFFDDKTDRHLSALRALNYPAQETPPPPGQIRAGAHTDYGTITILLPGQATGGLQVLTLDNSWLAVPDVPGGFVVNLGDLMAMWTNDRWRSTLHRVVNPEISVAATERRQSMAFFHQPNWDAEIECLPNCASADNPQRYAPTRSGPWLRAKVEASQHND